MEASTLFAHVDCSGTVYFQPPEQPEGDGGRMQSVNILAGVHHLSEQHLVLRLETGDKDLLTEAEQFLDLITNSVPTSTPVQDTTAAVIFLPRTDAAHELDTLQELVASAAAHIAAAAKHLGCRNVTLSLGP